MVYISGSAGQTDHQPGFGRDSRESELIRPASDKQTPAELFPVSASNFPACHPKDAIELDPGCLGVPAPKKTCPLGAARAGRNALGHGDTWFVHHPASSQKSSNFPSSNTPPERMGTEATTLFSAR